MKLCSGRILLLAFLALALVFVLPSVAGISSAPGPFANSGQDFFLNPEVLRLKLRLSHEAMDSLRRHPRTNVLAIFHEGEQVFPNVSVHLKGTSSFRALDDKPSFTLRFPNPGFHGLVQLHLNNSVEDPSYLNEFIGSEVFRAAGLPAARTRFALVELNGRSLGLYVLKEGLSNPKGMDGSPAGELYEPGPGHDVDEPLRLVFGEESQRVRLRNLAAAIAEPDLARRRVALNRILDVEQFVSFMALEVLMNHRDGYCMARNNFRLFRAPGQDRFIFLPHGMDQLFGKANATLLPRMSGRVAAALMDMPETAAMYRARIQSFSTNAFQLPVLLNKLDRRVNLLRPSIPPAEKEPWEHEVAALRNRISARHQEVLVQLDSWFQMQPRFIQGKAILTNWTSSSITGKGQMSVAGGQLMIRAEPGTAAAWKTRLFLDEGAYRFSAMVRTEGVQTQRSAKNPGARLRVSGYPPEPGASLTGSHSWKKLEITFRVVNSGQPVELLCELNADSGEVWWKSPFLEIVP